MDRCSYLRLMLSVLCIRILYTRSDINHVRKSARARAMANIHNTHHTHTPIFHLTTMCSSSSSTKHTHAEMSYGQWMEKSDSVLCQYVCVLRKQQLLLRLAQHWAARPARNVRSAVDNVVVVVVDDDDVRAACDMWVK